VRRLRARGSENEDALKIRIATAREEMKRRDEFDYLIVNSVGCQDLAVDQIVSIITAEHCRLGRSAPAV
jgi:guanylate kinase